jgi:hypothetical protein
MAQNENEQNGATADQLRNLNEQVHRLRQSQRALMIAIGAPAVGAMILVIAGVVWLHGQAHSDDPNKLVGDLRIASPNRYGAGSFDKFAQDFTARLDQIVNEVVGSGETIQVTFIRIDRKGSDGAPPEVYELVYSSSVGSQSDSTGGVESQDTIDFVFRNGTWEPVKHTTKTIKDSTNTRPLGVEQEVSNLKLLIIIAHILQGTEPPEHLDPRYWK